MKKVSDFEFEPGQEFLQLEKSRGLENLYGVSSRVENVELRSALYNVDGHHGYAPGSVPDGPIRGRDLPAGNRASYLLSFRLECPVSRSRACALALMIRLFLCNHSRQTAVPKLMGTPVDLLVCRWCTATRYEQMSRPALPHYARLSIPRLSGLPHYTPLPQT